MSALAGCTFTLQAKASTGAEPVEFNLETVGWLSDDRAGALQFPAARLLEFVLYYVGKYRLAASLHHDTMQANYVDLQRQHAALQASEARYRNLSEQLQRRVNEQVKVIELAQQQLYESARLRAIGQLAAGVAHEINNPIGFISSNLRVGSEYLDALCVKLSSDADTELVMTDFRALLEESISGARRIATIVTDLKTFTNIDQNDFVPCDLNALIASTCHLLEAENRHVWTIEQTLGEMPQLACYPAKISQALYNVLDNAVKSLGDSGNVRVTSFQTAHDELHVVVEDNGCGIAEKDLEQLFDPFFTTRPVGSGTGLGLSVARNIMVAHQGAISVRSQVGSGTQVTLRFLCR
ncbi:MAG: sensor histidine kinase [Pseudomonas sp.]|uniref:sensor histidine kinase n=1 Tax=Pseudomonas sp. TaxID=306 RepID=UPI003D6ED9D8